MDSSITIGISISLILSAFFSGLETAFVAANRLQIELDRKQGLFSGRLLSFFLKQEEHFITAMLIGNNIALVIFGIYFALLVEPFIILYITSNTILVLFIQSLLSTLLLVFTAEFIPKSLFVRSPNFYLRLFSLPLLLSYFILWPTTMILSFLTRGMLRLFTRKEHAEKPALGRVDLDHYVKKATDGKTPDEDLEHEVRIFKNALEFNKVKIRDCMIPRTEMVAMDVQSDLNTLREKFIETELSKIIIYKENIDNVIGYVHSYELFRNPENVQSALLPLSHVPESMAAQTLLQEFIRQHRTVAIVVDEFGGTAGMITIEDVIEEIFGEIEDEHDVETLTEERIQENEFLLSGRLEIDYLNEQYALGFPEDESYETLAGYILTLTTDLPDENTHLETEKHEILIEKMADNRIELIRVKLKS